MSRGTSRDMSQHAAVAYRDHLGRYILSGHYQSRAPGRGTPCAEVLPTTYWFQLAVCAYCGERRIECISVYPVVNCVIVIFNFVQIILVIFFSPYHQEGFECEFLEFVIIFNITGFEGI